MISLTSPVRTRAHRWPAGAKLLGLALATTLLFVLQGLAVQAGALVAILIAYALPGPEFLRHGWRQLRVIWPFVALLLLWHAFTGDMAKGAAIGLRMVSTVALANLVTMTTSLSELSDLLHRLLRPLRKAGLPVALIETGIPLVIRFTPALIARGRLLNEAWRARSSRRPNWHIVLPMAVLALDDADHLAEALRARGGLNMIDEE